jgi:choline dehydrogenase-like flavoprotein
MASFDYDVVIIGSGFGGSVAALRAAEKTPLKCLVLPTRATGPSCDLHMRRNSQHDGIHALLIGVPLQHNCLNTYDPGAARSRISILGKLKF